MLPGQTNRLWFKADTAGAYRGACAEYCGHQHAKMAFLVIAQEQADFDRWYNEQLTPAATPSDSLARAGLDVFLGKSCALCHQVRGTTAAAQVGPDLTHIASRLTLAAASIPNTRGYLGGWIMDPQSVKPHTRMPPTRLDAKELQAILAYLEGLR
jgi:cytochrome c oxidase subunit 2